ncbi:MAG: hypothetical protein IJQ47_08470 [Synergistaceae bacterium]|nr:hypothetical protein [Synergistaceae bacterium]
MSKQDLINQKQKLEEDIERLKKIVEAAADTTFDIIIEDLKNHMKSNIELEEWSTLKTNLKEVSAVNTTKDFLENQSKLLTKKQTELLELENQINNYQTNLFDSLNSHLKIDTKIKHNEQDLFTGDVFETDDKSYLIIKESELEKDNFVITGTAFEEALLLQYPKNRQILNNTAYLGNLFDNKELQTFLLKLEQDKEENKKEESDEKESEDKDDI